MSLRFIIGRAGTGKTHTCLEEIRSALEEQPIGPPLIYIVPEQATFQMEAALARSLSRKGFCRLYVMGFSRLALRILAETGGLARPALTPLGRHMLLRMLLQKHESRLRVFHRAARQPGFVVALEAALRELAQYGHDPEELGRLAAAHQGAVGLKLADLSLIWAEFRRAVAADHTNSDDYLQMAAEALPASGFIRSARVWIDGFSSFTVQEYRFLRALMQAAAEVHVALCLPPGAFAAPGSATKADRAFVQAAESAGHIKAMAEACGTPLAPPLILSRKAPRFKQAELEHVAEQFTAVPPAAYEGAVSAIRLVAAANRRAEVEAVARDIIRLCRDYDYRFREMAVIVRHLEPYDDLISAVFTDYGIPYFIDRRRPVAHHPAVELTRSALAAVANHNDTKDILRCLKTDLLPVTRDEADVLENLALRFGLTGKAWTQAEPWPGTVAPGTMSPGAVEPDQARLRVMLALAPLDCFRSGELTVARGAEAIYHFYEKVDLRARLEEWVTAAREEGRAAEAQLHQQVWEKLVDLLEQLVAVGGAYPVSPGEFRRIIETGLESLEMGLIPPTADQVLIGAVDRSRQPELRAVYLLGLNDKFFPLPGEDDPVLTDMERRLLAERGFSLPPTKPRRLWHEEYLCYIALTRASELLWVSYTQAGDDGRAAAPSPFFQRLQAIFPGAQVRVVGEEMEDYTSPRQLAADLVKRRGLGEPSAAVNFLRSLGDESINHILSSLSFTNEAGLVPGLADELSAGRRLKAAVSRLEVMAACPFRHFAQYILRLDQREVYRIEHTDVGRLVHETLHRLVRYIMKRAEQDPGYVPLPDEAMALAEQIVDKEAPRLRHEVFLSSAGHQYMVQRIKQTLNLAIKALLQHWQKSSFRPVATEFSFGTFGSRSQEVPAAGRLTLPGGLELCLEGRIDRIDVAVAGGVLYCRVIDYKGSTAAFRYSDMHYGLRLQLPVYLLTALECIKRGLLTMHMQSSPVPGVGETGRSGRLAEKNIQAVRPAGFYYFNVYEPWVEENVPLDEADLEEKLLRALRLSGLTVGDPTVIALSDSEGTGLLIPARLRRDGTPAKSQYTLSEEQLQALLQAVEKTVAAIGQSLLLGEAHIRPYRYGPGESACTYCPYHQVCFFDIRFAGNSYRYLDAYAGRPESVQEAGSGEI
ncbi:MAG TPA: hypothetical protein GXX29_06270 [Firmicutes bacterium]|nr:hypothetical protein [Bacillota bacterium]